MTRRLADSPIARWLSWQMSQYQDPESGYWGLRQQRLATLANVPQSSISQILSGQTQPSVKTLNALAEFFQVHPLIMSYIAYHLESADHATLADLTELGHILYQMPEEVVTGFLAHEARLQLERQSGNND